MSIIKIGISYTYTFQFGYDDVTFDRRNDFPFGATGVNSRLRRRMEDIVEEFACLLLTMLQLNCVPHFPLAIVKLIICRLSKQQDRINKGELTKPLHSKQLTPARVGTGVSLDLKGYSIVALSTKDIGFRVL